MELSSLLALCAENSQVTWINGWVNYREPGDLRRHRAHYDVLVMKHFCLEIILPPLESLTEDIDLKNVNILFTNA